MVTACVMTRVQLIEAPYLNEFIQWYIHHLKFSKIYFINTEPANLDKIVDFIDPTLKKYTHFTPHTGNVNTFPYARELFSTSVKEDYILHVDTDEFLVLPKKYTDVKDFIEQVPATRYVFIWVTLPIKELFRSSMLEYLRTPEAKYKTTPTKKMMVNRKDWLSDASNSMNMHCFSCKKGNLVKFDTATYHNGDEPFIIHFLVRGYLHVVLKIIHQRSIKQGGKNTVGEFITKSVQLPQYPQRIKIAMGECYSARVKVPIDAWNVPDDFTYPKVDECKILKLLEELLKQYSKGKEIDYTETDVFNLVDKINKGVKKLTTSRCPVRNVAGYSYLHISQKYLS